MFVEVLGLDMRMQKMQLCMSVLYKYIIIKTIIKTINIKHYYYYFFGPFHALSGTHDAKKQMHGCIQVLY